MESITVSYLPTKEDYVAYKTAMDKAAWKEQNNRFIRLLQILGSAVFLYGLIKLAMAVLSGGRMGQNFLNAILILGGVYLILYPDILRPVLVKKAAVAYYDTHGEKMISAQMQFTAETLKMTTDRYAACFPYTMLWRVYEDQKIILFYTGIGEARYLPKRVLSAEELETLHVFLRSVQKI